MTTTPYALRKVPTYTGPCVVCAQTFTAHYSRRICDGCRPEAYKAGIRANSLTKSAVRAGELQDPKKVKMRCVDCGGRAYMWEHRDYAKPLEVEPTCYSCNVRRGPALRPRGALSK